MIASSAGDRVLAAVDSRSVTVTGIVAQKPTGEMYVVADTHSVYRLQDASARTFMGRHVRIVGVLHEQSRVLDVKAISAFVPPPTTRS